jgi:phage shock protein PspC (stress-responsive transcriptional regulator)
MTETIPPDAAVPGVRRLTRTHDGRFLGGVCAGLGRYFDVSPTIYRIVFAALALAGGTGILLYLAAWVVIPDEGADASVAEQALRDHRDRPGFLVGLGLLAFAAIVLLAHAAFWPHPGNLWLAALVVGAGLIWWEVRGGRPAPAAPAAPGETAETAVVAAPPRPRKQSVFLPVVGVLLAAAGIIGLLEALDWASVSFVVALAASVLFVGAAIAIGAATGRGVAGLVGLGILLLLALVPALLLDVPLRGGVGNHTYRPVSAADVHRHYRLAVGNLTVDLTNVQIPTGSTPVTVSLGIGNLRVHVPRNVTVDATASASAGRIDVFGHQEDGTGVDATVHEPGNDHVLVLKTEVGAGNVEVDRG